MTEEDKKKSEEAATRLEERQSINDAIREGKELQESINNSMAERNALMGEYAKNVAAALKQEIQNVTDKYKGFLIVIAPEGTRQKVQRLKSGFLRIANETNSQIMMAGVDFSNKTIQLGDFFSPTGNVEKDLETIKDYFGQFSGKRPELF